MKINSVVQRQRGGSGIQFLWGLQQKKTEIVAQMRENRRIY